MLWIPRITVCSTFTGRWKERARGVVRQRNEGMVAVVVLLLLPTMVDAQWLNHPTPNIPRTSDGKPNLAAPAPRGGDGHPDLSGVWTVAQSFPPLIGVPIEALTAESKTLIHEREENLFRDRPAFRCHPNGPETVEAGGALSKRPL
jgi:hypothetical protein